MTAEIEMDRLLNSEIMKVSSRIILGIVFLFFAIAKIANPEQFAKEISNYQLFPDFSINLIAIILPWIELCLGFLLLAGLKVRASAIFTGLLMFGFILAVAAAMAKGLNISCGCSGANSPKVGIAKILENSALLVLAIYLSYLPYSKFSLEQTIRKSSDDDTKYS